MAGAILGATTANADTRIDDTHVRVEAGDTVSGIANKYGTDVSTIATASQLGDANKIFVGDILVLTPEAQQSTNNTNVQTPVVQNFANNQNTQRVTTDNVQQSQPQQQTTTSTTSQSQSVSTSVSLAGNSMASLRRSIESGGNYNTNTGNGYLGAYQFAPQTIAGIESATGMKWSMDPATQDAFADYYANSRYGGWEFTPTNGGW